MVLFFKKGLLAFAYGSPSDHADREAEILGTLHNPSFRRIAQWATRAGAPRVWLALEIALFGFGLWLVAPMPVSYAGGGGDDLLFVKLANSLLDGRWLGPYNQLTLVKGPFYPIFLAATALARIPPQAATQGIVLIGAYLVSHVVGRLCEWRGATTVCFAMMVVNPAPVDIVATLLLREPIYAGLIVLTLGLAARVYLLSSPKHVFSYRDLAWQVIFGLVCAAFWLTREEGVLMLPSFAVLAGWCLYRYVANGERRVLALLSLIAIPAVAGLLPVLLVAGINKVEYGVFRTDDFHAAPIRSAYAALSRIQHDHWQPTVPISRDALALAYRVSPAARMLQRYLDSPDPARGAMWVRVSCHEEPIPDCNDIEAGWTLWALRAAADDAGQYGSAKQADQFYRRLGTEIDAACDAGRLPCSGHRSSFFPPWRSDYLPLIIGDSWEIARQTAVLGPAKLAAFPTMVPPSMYGLYQRVTPGTARTVLVTSPDIWKSPLPAAQKAVAGWLIVALPYLTIWGLPAALLWVVWRAGRGIVRRRFEPLTAFAVAIGLAIVVRILFLGVMQAMLFPMAFRYLSPMFPLVLLLVAMFLVDVGMRAARSRVAKTVD